MVDDYELAYLYIGIMVRDGENVMINVVSATSEEERAAGEGDLELLLDVTEWYEPEELARYASAWYLPGEVSYFEETSDYGPCYTACKPLVDSNGSVVAMVCADYMTDTVYSNIQSNVVRNVLLILLLCLLFGVTLGMWLRRNVTKPIHDLEQRALRFARLSREGGDVSELSLDTDDIETTSEIRLLMNAMTTLSQEMTDQAKSAAVVKNYAKEMEEENQRLTEEAEAARKIAALTQSVSALLANMPGLCSSKDAETGKYLACNREFAEFANRESPEDVIGLTDVEIFGEETAKQFAEDDKRALSMDEPFSFYEETPDAEGNPREFQTTKLKFVDNATGRLCTLAMRLDYTEVTLARKEAEEAQAAYDKLLSANVLYAHMAHAFSENYSQIYYVDLITDWYATYSSGADMNDVAGELQGRDFFNASRENALSMICKDDHDEFF
jgi:PAS domain-containing protein